MDEGATVVAPCGNRYDGMYEWNNYKGWGYYDVTGTWQNRDEGWFSWYMPGTGVELKTHQLLVLHRQMVQKWDLI